MGENSQKGILMYEGEKWAAGDNEEIVR